MSGQAAKSEYLIRTRATLIGINTDLNGEVLAEAGIHVRNGVIAAVAPFDSLRAQYPDLAVEGGPDMIAFPGLVNGHHHSGLTPFQLGVPYGPLELWLPQFRGMRYVGHRLDTLYSAIEMLESGTTTVQHIHPGLVGDTDNWTDLSDKVIGAYRDIGMRVSFSFMIRDRNQLVHEDDEPFLAGLPEDEAAYWRPKLAASKAPITAYMDWFEAQKEAWAKADPQAVSWQLAPANLHWCSDDCLAGIFDTAQRTGSKIHMHLVETRLQAEYARRTYGKSAIRHLADLGCLTGNLTLGHGIWADAEDLDLVRECGCTICHNASSGLRLASGVAPVNDMLQRGVPVCLGIDQAGINDDRDMLQEMRLVWALHREPGLATFRPSAGHVFRMATEHGAATTGFEGRIGRLDVGKAADIVLVDWNDIARPFIDDRVPLVDALLQRTRQMPADTVFVAGRKVVSEGRVTSIDRNAVLEEIRTILTSALTPQEREAQDRTAALLQHMTCWFDARYRQDTRRAYRFNAIAGQS
ncbi:amidohydrolase family protein [Stappia sp. BW2]|uniref:amidohydrolase family protein n=1 Tax=Stappia sp. BW2 TaxID=2592622 RepID=UPI0011DE730F|nr:amidohydrolase family protein [Stappia sp. BW2]TYC64114.1 amidohydrolase family protein [Stappia sp. BW2]